MRQTRSETRFAICVEDRYSDDLAKGKVYVILADDVAKREGHLRVIDESGEDCLYPESYFVFVELPSEARAALLPES